MKVVGFTFIRNAVKYDYPVREAVLSILPLCSEVIVAVGNSDDGTRELVEQIAPGRVRIIDTVWDDSLREGGRVLAQETDKAYAAVPEDADWAFYIQGDEVLPESDAQTVYTFMHRYKDDERVDGLLFRYRHFYGSYDYTGASSSWYRNEIRVVRKRAGIYSYRDAQGFRKDNDQKLNVVAMPAYIHHYGWVKEPAAMQRKQENFHKMWHDDAWLEKHVAKAEEFHYSGIDQLERYTGTHPKVMEERIRRKNWKFDYDIAFNRTSFKERAKSFLRRYLGLDFSYRNYRLLK
ncbi:MAG: glycosyltransferase family 2 protein [Bacteroidia bacterium]|nr:glycosyltransferase family 2 protein [Bacteroidia bacterium]